MESTTQALGLQFRTYDFVYRNEEFSRVLCVQSPHVAPVFAALCASRAQIELIEEAVEEASSKNPRSKALHTSTMCLHIFIYVHVHVHVCMYVCMYVYRDTYARTDVASVCVIYTYIHRYVGVYSS